MVGAVGSVQEVGIGGGGVVGMQDTIDIIVMVVVVTVDSGRRALIRLADGWHARNAAEVVARDWASRGGNE